MNLHASNPYNRTGYRRLPETFDVDFIKHIHDVYLDHWLPDGQEQNWDEIEKQVHEDFDERFGREKVTRHLKEARS